MQERTLHHFMTITGVQIEKQEAKRWKIENSYGTKEGINGYLVMSDNYFNEYVLQVIVDKKYLTEEERKIIENKSKGRQLKYRKEKKIKKKAK